MKDLDHKDEQQDQVQIEENLEPVQNQVKDHVESDEAKWADVYAKLDEAYAKIEALSSRINDMIAQGAVINDSTETSLSEDEDEKSEVEQMDNEFYERQKRYLY